VFSFTPDRHRGEAFRYLSLAMAARDPALVNLAVGPQWDDLRGDPRFEDALRVMGLQETHR